MVEEFIVDPFFSDYLKIVNSSSICWKFPQIFNMRTLLTEIQNQALVIITLCEL